MNYIIEFKSKNTDTIIIDSVKTIADASEIRFASMKMKNGNYQITFGYALSPPAKCKTCPDAIPKPKNMTKGINIYGRKGEKKNSFRIKKFKQLPDLKTP
ncbi:MAG: hypothetical protein HY063_08410 [Bacteroidetes bacterium]|nr:hypothetical protein [Bacteroidota bacterium]